jgi:hypothetical protein
MHLAAKTRADLSEDGTALYSSTVRKCGYPTPALRMSSSFLHRVDGDKFTGFIVERGKRRISTLGAEEQKLGIKGSSTRQVFFENVSVPKENLLGEIGKGHLIAFNALEHGPLQVGRAFSWWSGWMSADTVRYNMLMSVSSLRQPIASNFGAIQVQTSRTGDPDLSHR